MKREPSYSPLARENLGVSVAEALLHRPVDALPPEPFLGAGVYALYYTGGFAAYKAIAEANHAGRFAQPIYVGKAIPAGARRGNVGLDEDPGQVLWNRLKEHGSSLDQARNLELGDFSCRYLCVQDIWIPLGETLLIRMFSPLWNLVVDGFGNHDPGKGRYNQAPSQWDVLHPGRQWASRLAGRARPVAEIEEEAREFLRRPTEG